MSTLLVSSWFMLTKLSSGENSKICGLILCFITVKISLWCAEEKLSSISYSVVLKLMLASLGVPRSYRSSLFLLSIGAGEPKHIAGFVVSASTSTADDFLFLKDVCSYLNDLKSMLMLLFSMLLIFMLHGLPYIDVSERDAETNGCKMEL